MLGLPEVILNREIKIYPILSCCAKRSILPNKAETSEKAVRSFYGQNSTAQRLKMGYILVSLSYRL